MPQANALNLLAVSLLLGMSSPATALPPSSMVSQTQQYAQAQPTLSPMEQDYQDRLRAARTPEERALIQAEHDRLMQQGAVPGVVAPAPNTIVAPAPNTVVAPAPNTNVKSGPARP